MRPPTLSTADLLFFEVQTSAPTELDWLDKSRRGDFQVNGE